MKKETFRHIEAELYCYHETLKEIEKKRQEIMYNYRPDENIGGGKSNIPGSPTETVATRLAENIELKRLEEIVGAIKFVYDSSPEEHKKLIKLKYWTKPQLLTWDGIADKLHISKRQAMRWRDEIVHSIAKVLGWK